MISKEKKRMKKKIITLEEHQYETHKNLMLESKGILLGPTGCGKTYEELVAIGWKTYINPKKNVSIICTPRILLNQQFTQEVRKVLDKGTEIYHPNGLIFKVQKETRIIVFHSGDYNPEVDNEHYWKEIATTNVKVVRDEIEKANKMDQNVIIISTYHSLHKLESIENINTKIADECHNLIERIFHDNWIKVKADNEFFFTATMIVTGEDGEDINGRAMNNIAFFGRILNKNLPKTLIERKIICDIRLHFSKLETDDRQKTYIDEIIRINKFNSSFLPNMPYHKILNATGGTSYISKIEKHIKKIQQHIPGYDIFTITYLGAKINGEKVSREKFREELKKPRNALIFHFDILTEGLDIGDMTGVIIQRNLKRKDFLQTIGRAMRIYKKDPNKKPYAIITITGCNDDNEMIDFAKKMFELLHSAGFDMSENKIFTDDNIIHKSKDKGIDDAYGLSTRDIQTELGKEIKHWLYDKGFVRDLNNAIDLDGNIKPDELEKLLKEYI